MNEKTAQVDQVFARVASNVAARYQDAEADDIKQELWVWYLENDFEPNVIDHDWATYRTMFTVAERYAKKERTAKQGPGETYTTDEVFALVELLVNPETNDEYQRLGAEMAEVLTAVTRLPEDQRAALALKAAGTPYRVIAERSEASVATVHRRVQQALSSIVNSLNGEQRVAD